MGSYNHDVFLNHRGPDTKDGFVSHLMEALKERGLNPFLDKQSLRKGDPAQPAIFEALYAARVHIALVSKNYAQSKFCLTELVALMETHRERRVPVIPVFFVEPAHLRRVDFGPFADAFAQHYRSGEDPTTVEEWENALAELAEITGFLRSDYKGRDNEATLKRDIVDAVMQHFPELNKMIVPGAKAGKHAYYEAPAPESYAGCAELDYRGEAPKWRGKGAQKGNKAQNPVYVQNHLHLLCNSVSGEYQIGKSLNLGRGIKAASNGYGAPAPRENYGNSSSSYPGSDEYLAESMNSKLRLGASKAASNYSSPGSSSRSQPNVKNYSYNYDDEDDSDEDDDDSDVDDDDSDVDEDDDDDDGAQSYFSHVNKRNDRGYKSGKSSRLAFKLFHKNHRLPQGQYRLATMQDVSVNESAQSAAMPGWEVALLADGYVEGSKLGGRTWMKSCDNATHQLAAYYV